MGGMSSMKKLGEFKYLKIITKLPHPTESNVI